MPTEIVLLTDANEASTLIPLLSDAAPKLSVVLVQTLDELQSACSTFHGSRRLIAFCTSVIVPDTVLSALNGPAYNFHPGPPNYPGLYPACFAIYDGANRFGATAHVMTGKIDSGPIVGVDWIEIPPTIDRLNLEALSHQLVVHLFQRMALALATSDEPLVVVPESWSGRVTTRQDFENLCEVLPDVSADEFHRRHRAVGEGHEHAMFVTLHGRRFLIENMPGDGKVYVGGQVVNGEGG
jgi:methionyl-tRNA formyltransferase